MFTRGRRTIGLGVSALLGLLAAGCGDGGGAGTDTDTDAAAGGAPSTGGTQADASADGGQAVTPDAAPPVADAAAPVPDAEAPDAAVACPAYRYDPLNDTELTTFPDDFYTVDDPSQGTGVKVSTANAPWRAGIVRAAAPVFADLDTLDGFGVSAGVVLRFTAPVPAPESGPSTVDSGAIQLWALGDTPHRVPFEVETTDGGATLILWPMVPLPQHTRAGVVVTQAAYPAGCADRAPVLSRLLDGSAGEPEFTRLVPRYAELLSAAGVQTDDVMAATVFTTQSVTAVSEAVAAHVADQAIDFAAPPTCTAEANTLHCEATAELDDYRVGDTIPDATPKAKYTVPFTIWLPKDAAGPMPLIVFGHGLGGSRDNASGLADAFCPQGFAVFAVDALGHGQHPTAPAGNDPLALISFLGMDVATQTIHAARIRDNLRQSSFDKMQLLHLLDRNPDLNGDGQVDLDMTRVAYWGVSLGGIMGSEPLALDHHYSAGILTVGGARLIPIVTQAPAFAQFRPFLQGFAGGANNLTRLAPVVQAVADGGDPAGYAPHVLSDRLPIGGERRPHVLQTMAIDDQIVFNPANRMLARALGLQVVPPVSQDVGVIETSGPAPVSANIDGVTAGLFQYDRVRESPNSRPVAAAHDNAFGYEPIEQMFNFLVTWRDAAAPVIIDPYTELNTPPL